MKFRKRIQNSRRLAWLLAAGVGAYLGLCQRTTRWDVQGLDQLKADLRDGPVLLLMWHGRSLMGPIHWPVETAPLSSLFDASCFERCAAGMGARYETPCLCLCIRDQTPPDFKNMG